MPELDLLRGIPVLGVVLLHAFYWQYATLALGPWDRRFVSATQPGWVGVNLFFVLSGFRITGILLDSKSKPYFYRGFYTHRVLRILPAYYLLLIVLLVLRSFSAAFVGLSFVYLANYDRLLWGRNTDHSGRWPWRSHFYILWPTVVDKATPRRLALILAVIIVLTPVLGATFFSLGHRAGLDCTRGSLLTVWAAGSLTHPASHWDLEEAGVESVLDPLGFGGRAAHGRKSSWHYDA